MKFLYVTLLCLITAQFTFAQSAKSKKPFTDRSWFSMNAGLAVPIEDFGSDDVNSAEAGLAKIGFIGKLDLGIKVYKSLGICVSGMIGQNNINESPMEIGYQMNGINEEINTTPWKYIGGMGGIYMTSGIGRGALVLKGQIGYASVASYSLDWLISNTSQFARFEVESVRTGAVVVDLGVMTMIPISDVAFLNVGVDYFNTTPKFKNVTLTETSTGTNPSYSTVDYSMNIKLITVNLGVVWQM